jgi:hypothetical protein
VVVWVLIAHGRDWPVGLSGHLGVPRADDPFIGDPRRTHIRLSAY